MPAIQNSILDTTKKMLGLDAEYDAFDIDVITHINSTFAQLSQIGAGPKEGFAISGSETLWTEYLQDNVLLNFIKSYMYLKVRLWFDPPTTSFDLTAKTEQIKELEWRINVAADKAPPVTPPPTEDETPFVPNYYTGG